VRQRLTVFHVEHPALIPYSNFHRKGRQERKDTEVAPNTNNKSTGVAVAFYTPVSAPFPVAAFPRETRNDQLETVVLFHVERYYSNYSFWLLVSGIKNLRLSACICGKKTLKISC
jgi:hypothetical protein